MTTKGILAISLKLMGIYSLIQSISLLQPFGMFISAYSKLIEININLSLMYFASLLPSLILIIIAFILLFFGDRIANKFMVSNQTYDSFSNLSTKDMQSIAFSIIGVVIFLLAFIKLVRSGSSILFAFQSAKLFFDSWRRGSFLKPLSILDRSLKISKVWCHRMS